MDYKSPCLAVVTGATLVDIDSHTDSFWLVIL